MFQGYSDETFEFFMAIRFNNNADFFHSNHDWYLRSVREPSLALAEALSPTVEWLDDALQRHPNRVVSRINRDIRFTKDKSPYRDSIWLAFRRPGEEKRTTIGVYFEITASGGSYGMGIYNENKPMMNALRRAILTQPDSILDAWTPIREEFPLYGSSYRRMAIPETVPEALRPLYPLKGFYFEKALTNFQLLKSPALVDEIVGGFQRMVPLYRCLRALVPIEDEDNTVQRL